MILSFAWTTDALLAGNKTCTRRLWSDRTARAWINAYNGSRLIHAAWDKCSFVKGAKKIADIRLTQLPYQERLNDMPQSDLDAEGGLWSSLDEFINLFGSPETVVWVVRFQLMLPLVDTHGTGLQLGNAPWVDIAPMSALELGHTTNSVGRKRKRNAWSKSIPTKGIAPSKFSFSSRDAKNGFSSHHHLYSISPINSLIKFP